MKSFGLRTMTLFMTVVCIAACNSDDSNTPSARDEIVGGPDQIMTNSEIYLTSEGRRKATIKSDTLLYYSRVDSTLLYNVHVLFFDTTGVQTSTLTADSSHVNQRTNTMSAFGHVKAWSGDNRRLHADSLRWNAKTGRIETEGYVEIYRGTDMVSGYGLEADQRLEQTVIKRNPRGSFGEQ